MKIITSVLLIVMFSLKTIVSSGQDSSHTCSCSQSKELLVKPQGFPIKINALARKDSNYLILNVINNREDTFYLFDSYLKKDYYSSRHLHRIDTKKGIYKISFLPIIPFLTTELSDVIKNDPLFKKGQITYHFTQLLPNSIFEIKIPIKELLRNSELLNNVIKDYDVRQLNKYSKSNYEEVFSNNLRNTLYKFQIELAVYRSVELLCKKGAYYYQEEEFDRQSKDFELLSVDIDNIKYIFDSK
ncbi:hypothetical protein [Mucilaginibacter pedocola]|uniref:Uncharacterized protein n=1 Tax=Mucilaginibacter pedocola TaxID=1792845 RepID=A0A1S9PBN1_9SPHI|nr:hypothetical protein [Mucilaginibacter pedocola]OOQ58394.1 hypothetical protein BC343_30245 [Mucilaginibacter pedocola]